MTLYAMRHFPTQDNIDKRFALAERDIPILHHPDIPEETAELLAQIPADAHVCVSGLQRTRQTLQEVSEYIMSPQKQDPQEIIEFNERYGGKLSGLLVEDFLQTYNLHNRTEYWTFTDPSLGQETIEDFLARVTQGLHKIAQHKTVLLFTHGGVIKAIDAVLHGGNTLEGQLQILTKPSPKNGTIATFEI